MQVKPWRANAALQRQDLHLLGQPTCAAFGLSGRAVVPAPPCALAVSSASKRSSSFRTLSSSCPSPPAAPCFCACSVGAANGGDTESGREWMRAWGLGLCCQGKQLQMQQAQRSARAEDRHQVHHRARSTMQDLGRP